MVQLVPLVVVQSAGWPLWEPTDTKPVPSAATASTWLEPLVSFTSCARVQLARSAEWNT